MTDQTPKIVIQSVTNYVEQQSKPDKDHYVFSYTITIENQSDRIACRLLSRLWLIQDSNLKTEEVIGEGVVGQQPIIRPGEQFSYNSGAVLQTDIGTMEGKYFFVTLDPKQPVEFSVLIPKFVLSIPRTLH